jgi:enoyl-[acyl-carrier protein] reductase I
MTNGLEGKKGLIIGVANEKSIAWGCAKAFHAAGAELAVTYLNNKAESFVRPLAEQVDASMILPLDVQNEDEIETVFAKIARTWGKLDFLLHSIAFAPKQDLHSRVVDCSRDGFLKSMDISCYSLIRLSHYAEPLMKTGGTILTITYYGGEKVVENYRLMGPVKAALEGAVKYLAAELGAQKIRVNALSPGPLLTRAASGLYNFDALLEAAKQRAPVHELVPLDEIGAFAAFLVSDQARHITGNISYIDSGLHVLGG